MRRGIADRITQATIQSPLTPLLLFAALALGLTALLTIPREEEPQISVPMVDIHVEANGLAAADAVELVTKPLEEIVKAISGVEHVYSMSYDDQVVVTARFLVGTSADDAILRVHEKIRANLDRIPVGIPEPLIVGRGINDVAIVAVTLSPSPAVAERWSAEALNQLAEELRAEMLKVDDVGLTYLAGAAPAQIRVEPDPEKLALYGLTLEQLVGKISGANRSFMAGQVREAGRNLTVAAGQTLQGIPDIGLLLVSTRDGRPVYVKDVATVIAGSAPVEARAWNIVVGDGGVEARTPAVSLAIAKRAGANAVVVAERVIAKIEALEGSLIPEGIEVRITRDYGETANEKANELLFHLGLATVSIVLLIAFAIGILVDDAIVVIENIARHWGMNDGRSRIQGAVQAVAEVGNPTIVATLTVIAALLPMLFVSGLMGPYMAPIPANASAAMLFSFFVAVAIAPWMMVKLAPKQTADSVAVHHHDEGALGRVYRIAAAPILASRTRSLVFLLVVGVLTFASMALFATRDVTVKLLPFDNKSELQVTVDLPEGASLEDTERVLFAAAGRLKDLPELTSIQAYAGTASPFNFNGLVRHSYLRATPELGDLQLNLSPKGERDRESHAIALDVRARLAGLPAPEGTAIKVVEVPPGPPVLATLLAEIYGPDAQTRRAVAEEVKAIFKDTPFIVDVDDSWGTPRPRLRVSIDQDRLEYFGVEQSAVYDTVSALLSGVTVGYSHRGEGRDPIEIAVRLPKSGLTWSERLASTPVPADSQPGNRAVVELGDVVHVSEEAGSLPVFRRDGHFAEMVQAELAGAYEAPIYGMLEVQKRIDEHDWGSLPKPAIGLHGQPEDETKPTLLWDGEWEITYVTFRDMGAAFAIAILGIYVLVVAQFGSFKLPLVILTPVPLTLVGILPGHWLLGAPFTATSMIGFIALAGIIVRNSILLVDFIREHPERHRPLVEILLDAGAIRFKPILLTALAAMIGAATILLDPIFQGLAISLLFGLLSSTLLTVLVIPAIYMMLRERQHHRTRPEAPPASA